MTARRREVVALLAAAAAAPGLAATPGVDAPPPPAPPRPVTVPPIFEHRLPNGLRVVIAPRRDVPLVSATLLVRAGPEADPDQRAGLAAMTAALLAKGARRGGRVVGATALARQAEALGGSLDSGSSWRVSSAAMTVATPQMARALALLADVVRAPVLAADELERARTQALDGLRVTLSSPGEVAGLAARRAFWGASAYGSVNSPASLKRLTRADVLAFHRRWYLPDRAALVLAGDIGEAQGVALARRLLGDWRAPADPPPPLRLAPPQPIEPKLVLVDMPGSGQSGVVLLAPDGPLDTTQRRIAQVASALLGGGYSARLNQEIRIKRGLSYGAGADLEVHPEGSMFSAQAQTQHATAAQVLQLMRAELQRLGEQPPPADELAARQAGLIGGFARRLETVGGLASVVIASIVNDRPLADLSQTVERILAVTPEQVREFVATRWRAERWRAVVAGDLKAGGAALRELDGQPLQVPLAALDLDRPMLGAVAR